MHGVSPTPCAIADASRACLRRHAAYLSAGGLAGSLLGAGHLAGDSQITRGMIKGCASSNKDKSSALWGLKAGAAWAQCWPAARPGSGFPDTIIVCCTSHTVQGLQTSLQGTQTRAQQPTASRRDRTSRRPLPRAGARAQPAQMRMSIECHARSTGGCSKAAHSGAWNSRPPRAAACLAAVWPQNCTSVIPRCSPVLPIQAHCPSPARGPALPKSPFAMQLVATKSAGQRTHSFLIVSPTMLLAGSCRMHVQGGVGEGPGSGTRKPAQTQPPFAG